MQAQTAAVGGAGRRSAKIAAAPMDQLREAHRSARPLHSPEGGQSAAVFAAAGPHEGALSWTDTLGHRRQGYAPLRVGNDVGVDVGNDVGVGGHQRARCAGLAGERGRAAELASEAARAEGASITWPRRVADGRRWSRSSAIKVCGRTRWLCGAAFGGA
jgi:hypothetical protein